MPFVCISFSCMDISSFCCLKAEDMFCTGSSGSCIVSLSLQEQERLRSNWLLPPLWHNACVHLPISLPIVSLLHKICLLVAFFPSLSHTLNSHTFEMFPQFNWPEYFPGLGVPWHGFVRSGRSVHLNALSLLPRGGPGAMEASLCLSFLLLPIFCRSTNSW